MNDENLPYRSPVQTMLQSQAPASTPDNIEYSTLKAVRGILADGVKGLYKDFNAFKVLDLDPSTDMVAIQAHLRQVAGKQEAFDILSPILEAVDQAMKVQDDIATNQR